MRKIVLFYNNYKLPYEVRKVLYKRIKGGYYVYTPLLDVREEKIVAYRLVNPKSNEELQKIISIGGFETYHYFRDIVFLEDIDESKKITSYDVPVARDSEELIYTIENMFGGKNKNVRIVSIPDNIDWEIETTYNENGIPYEYVVEKHKSWKPDWEDNYENDTYDDDDDDDDFSHSGGLYCDTEADYFDRSKPVHLSTIPDYFKKEEEPVKKSDFVNEGVISDIMLRFKAYISGGFAAKV